MIHQVHLWLLGIVLVHLTDSGHIVSNRPNGRISYSGYNEKLSTDLIGRILSTHKYHWKLFTSHKAKLMNPTTDNYIQVNTNGTVLYKRRYTTTADCLKEFPFNWGAKRVPLICSCAMSKRNTRSKLEISINPNTTVTTKTPKIRNNISFTVKTSEDHLYLTISSLSTSPTDSSNPKFTDQIFYKNLLTTQYTNDTSKDHLKEIVSSFKPFTSPARNYKNKKPTIRRFPLRETKKNINNYYERLNHPSSPFLLAYTTKKRKPITYTKRHSNRLTSPSDDSVCFICSKPVLPIHTLIRTKLPTKNTVSHLEGNKRNYHKM